MNKEKLNRVLRFIRVLETNNFGNQINLCYNMYDCTLGIGNEFGSIRYYENCSLTNFNKILMLIKNEVPSAVKIDVFCQEGENKFNRNDL